MAYPGPTWCPARLRTGGASATGGGVVASALFFGLLGPVVARVDGVDVALGGPRARAVLAVLLLGAGRVVPLDAIVDAAWGEPAPETARFQSQNRVSALR